MVTPASFSILLLMQLALYCIPADYIAAEAAKFGDCLFGSLWYYKHDQKIWKACQFAIQRSQKQTKFAAGGLMDFDVKALVSVIKLSWSANAVMRAMKNKIQNPMSA